MEGFSEESTYIVRGIMFEIVTSLTKLSKLGRYVRFGIFVIEKKYGPTQNVSLEDKCEPKTKETQI